MSKPAKVTTMQPDKVLVEAVSKLRDMPYKELMATYAKWSGELASDEKDLRSMDNKLATVGLQLNDIHSNELLGRPTPPEATVNKLKSDEAKLKELHNTANQRLMRKKWLLEKADEVRRERDTLKSSMAKERVYTNYPSKNMTEANDKAIDAFVESMIVWGVAHTTDPRIMNAKQFLEQLNLTKEIEQRLDQRMRDLLSSAMLDVAQDRKFG